MNAIDEKIGGVPTEAIDLTFGEIVNASRRMKYRSTQIISGSSAGRPNKNLGW